MFNAKIKITPQKNVRHITLASVVLMQIVQKENKVEVMENVGNVRKILIVVIQQNRIVLIFIVKPVNPVILVFVVLVILNIVAKGNKVVVVMVLGQPAHY